jgi:Chaperone of endosialidase
MNIRITTLLMCLFISSVVPAQSVSINKNGDAPDSSSILDVQSTSKGMLVPRMDSTQREMISNPAEGLLVYDTDSGSFWFRQTGEWAELVNSISGLRDKDNDTKITVEQSPDEDTIRFTVKGEQFASMDGKTLGIGVPIGSVYLGYGAGLNTADSVRHNTFVGNNAGFSSTTGNRNTYIGHASGYRDTVGFRNVAIGDSALASASGVFDITAVGYHAGLQNNGATRTVFIGALAGEQANSANSIFIGYRAGLRAVGGNNIAIGFNAGIGALNGLHNTFVGSISGVNTQGGSFNSFYGAWSGAKNSSGSHNIYIGYRSGGNNTTGNFNVAIGDSAMYFSNPVSRVVAIGHAAGMMTTDSLSSFVGYNAGKFATGNNGTHIGHTAGLMSLGSNNTTIGTNAGNDTLSGSNNTFVGVSTGGTNKSGSRNTFIGQSAGASNTSGSKNTFLGALAGLANTDGKHNTYIGVHAGQSSTAGDNNIFIGTWAGFSSNMASNNVFIGFAAGQFNGGNSNAFLGTLAGENNSFGSRNTYLGDFSGRGQTGVVSADMNTFVGKNSGYLIGSGERNVFIGDDAGYSNSEGNRNTFVGENAGISNTAGNNNTYLGQSAGFNNAGGSDNVYLGYQSGLNDTVGSRNVFLGRYSGYFETGSDRLYIDNDSISTPLIYGDFDSNYTTIHGDLGINIKNPDRELVVYDTDNDGDAVLKLVADSSSRELLVGVNQSSGGFISMETDNKLDLGTNGITRMTIANNGEVGIGTTSPDRDLTVFDIDGNGSAVINVKDATRELFLGVNSIGVSLRSLSNDHMSFWTNNIRHMTIETSGDVGIGTSNPEYKMHIQDNGTAGSPTIDLVLESSTSKRPTILFSENASSLDLNDGMSIEYNGSASGNELTINAVGGAPVMTIESTDKQVGIGTTNPDRELTVSDSDGNGSAAINVKDATRELFLGTNSSGITLGSLTNHDVSFWTNNVRRMTIENGGKVGIGTANPDRDLTVFDVDGSGSAIINVKDATRELFLGTNSSGITLRSLTNHDVSFWTNNVRRMTIENAGEVGIGTTNPTALLEVNSSIVKKIGGGSWTASSDRRLKKNIKVYKEGLDAIMQIRPVRYQYNNLSGYDTRQEHIGVIAQELQKVTPHMVSSYKKEGVDYLQVDNSAMTYMLINAIKEQQLAIEKLTEQNEVLAHELNVLKEAVFN